MWVSIIRSTWRAYPVFMILWVIAVVYQFATGRFADKSWIEIIRDVGIAACLLYLVAFITSLIYHYQVWRNSRWPGGGGPRNR